MNKFYRKLIFFLASLFVGNVCCSQPYPTKSIELIAPFGVGGSTDIMARAIAKSLVSILKQPVVVVNKPGASGSIGLTALARSAADGYTIGIANVGGLGTAPACIKNPPYDSVKDFAPVSMFASVPNIMTVHRDFPANNYKELIRELKRNPNKYNYGVQFCTQHHMIIEQLKLSNNVDIAMVPYKTASAMLMDALNGTVALSSETRPLLNQHIVPGGLLKPIAIAWPHRLPELPNVPTWTELGMPDANIESWYGIIVPAGTPPDVINTLYLAMKQAAKDPELQETIKNSGAYPRSVVPPEEFGRIIKQEAERHRKTVELGRVKLD